MTLLGVGNVLQKDDGIGVYAAMYLSRNYTFTPDISIVNGGVEGINLYNVAETADTLLIFDTVLIDDTPGSIYLIPANELQSRGLNSGGAHEIGILQVLDMFELRGKRKPDAYVLGIVPQHITFDIALSDTLKAAFESYIAAALRFVQERGIKALKRDTTVSLQALIDNVKRL